MPRLVAYNLAISNDVLEVPGQPITYAGSLENSPEKGGRQIALAFIKIDIDLDFAFFIEAGTSCSAWPPGFSSRGQSPALS